MHPDLRRFVADFLGTVSLTLILVAIASFLFLPMSLTPGSVGGRHEIATLRHMT